VCVFCGIWDTWHARSYRYSYSYAPPYVLHKRFCENIAVVIVVCAVSVARAALNRIFGLKVHSLCAVDADAALQQQQQQQKSRPGQAPKIHIHIHAPRPQTPLQDPSRAANSGKQPSNDRAKRLGLTLLSVWHGLWSAHVHSSNNLVKLTRSTERVLPSGSQLSRVWLQSGEPLCGPVPLLFPNQILVPTKNL